MNGNRRLAAQVAGLVALFLVGMALAGSTALGKGKPSSTQSTTDTSSSTSAVTTQASAGKTLVCHRTHSKKKPFHTISVSVNAVTAHLNHGDTAGACVLASQNTATTTTASPKVHGNSANAKGHNK